MLRSRGQNPSVAQARGAGAATERREKRQLSIPLLGRVKVEDIGVYSRSFATMVNAGVTLPECLDILSEQTENPTLRKATTEIKSEVESGSSLSEALGKHQKIFDELYRSMVRAGEASGNLDIILDQLSELLEKEQDLRNKVKSALFMPIMVLGACVLITLVLLIFVVPIFDKMFADFGAALPAPTQALINVSNAMKSLKGILALVGIGFFGFVMTRIVKTEKGQFIWDKIKLKLPLFGSLIEKKVVASFARTYALLEHSGVPILDALEIVSETTGNKIISREIKNAKDSIQQGENLSTPLQQSGVFPPMVTSMIVVGEKTGNVETMLDKVADLYGAEVERSVEGLTKLIEPLMMMVVGVLVGGIVICLYLPVFQLAGAMGGG